MAYCPECKGEMGTMQTVCPHCGHQFRPRDHEAEQGSSALGCLGRWFLTLLIFAAGYVVMSFFFLGAAFGELLSITSPIRSSASAIRDTAITKSTSFWSFI